MIRNLASILACSFALVTAGHAGESAPPLSSKAVMPELDEIVESDWSFQTQFDAWIVQMSVNVNPLALGFEQNIFLSTKDIVSNLDWLVPVGADLRYKRLGFLPNVTGLKISGDGETPGALYSDLEVGMTMWVANLPVYYRAIDKPGYTLDLLAGARLLSVDIDLDYSGGPVGNNRGRLSANAGTDNWDAIAGFRVQGELNDRVFYSVYGDIGAGESDLTWQVLAGLGYRVNDRLSALLAYRYLYYEGGDEVKAVDVTGSGPQLSLTWDF